MMAPSCLPLADDYDMVIHLDGDVGVTDADAVVMR